MRGSTCLPFLARYAGLSKKSMGRPRHDGCASPSTEGGMPSSRVIQQQRRMHRTALRGRSGSDCPEWTSCRVGVLVPRRAGHVCVRRGAECAPLPRMPEYVRCRTQHGPKSLKAGHRTHLMDALLLREHVFGMLSPPRDVASRGQEGCRMQNVRKTQPRRSRGHVSSCAADRPEPEVCCARRGRSMWPCDQA